MRIETHNPHGTGTCAHEVYDMPPSPDHNTPYWGPTEREKDMKYYIKAETYGRPGPGTVKLYVQGEKGWTVDELSPGSLGWDLDDTGQDGVIPDDRLAGESAMEITREQYECLVEYRS